MPQFRDSLNCTPIEFTDTLTNPNNPHSCTNLPSKERQREPTTMGTEEVGVGERDISPPEILDCFERINGAQRAAPCRLLGLSIGIVKPERPAVL